MWISEYNHLMFESINNDDDTIKATIFKNKYMPEIVYKYRNVSDRNINALAENFLMAVAPSMLNDPYEGALYIDFKNRWMLIYQVFVKIFYKNTGYKLAIDINKYGNRDELFAEMMKCLGIPNKDLKLWNYFWSAGEKMLEKMLIEFQQELKNINDDLHRVCSFSQCNDSNPMWAHYADDFKGYCVGYNIKELRNDLTDLLLPVRYKDSLLEVDDSFFSEGQPNKSFFMDSLTRKSTQWSYEKEWRLLLQSDESGLYQKIQLPNPKVIILGKDISDEDQEKLIQIANSLDAKCFKQNNTNNTYGYDLIEL